MNMNVNTATYTMNHNGEETSMEFNYYTKLRASDKLRFVNEVTDLVVGENNYSSVIEDMIFDFEIVNIFTDIDLTDVINSSNNIDSIEDFLNETNIVEIVVENVEAGLIESLRKAVNNNIEYKTGIHRNTLSDALASLVNTIEKQVEGVDVSKLMSMAETMSSLTGSITPEKVLDAYANSDMFKLNVEEREEKRKEHIEKLNKIMAINKE